MPDPKGLRQRRYHLLIRTAGQTVAELAAPHGHGPSYREAERSGYGHRNLVALGVLHWFQLLMHYVAARKSPNCGTNGAKTHVRICSLTPVACNESPPR
jgi:hypothetical protein